MILHDELHKSILLLFRQADTYLAQFNQHILDHIRCAQMTNILGSPMKPHNLFRLCTAVLCQQGRISGGDLLVIIQIEPLVQIEKGKLAQFLSAILIRIGFALFWGALHRRGVQVPNKICE